jgi:hypothetical protein
LKSWLITILLASSINRIQQVTCAMMTSKPPFAF